MNYPITTHCLPPQQSHRPIILCIGGSDSAGLAGIQMDSRCAQALQVHCATAITAVTAQTNAALSALNPVSDKALGSQIEAGLSLQPQAIKIGMLVSVSQVLLVANKLASYALPIVFDPVLATSSDAITGNQDMLDAMRQHLLPLCTIITPNLPEAAHLLGIEQAEASWHCAQKLHSLGPSWAVLKGGHQAPTSSDLVTDYVYGSSTHFSLSQPRLSTAHTRGTGCALASSLASLLALGYEVRDALVISKMVLQTALSAATPINNEKGCLVPQGFPTQHWPRLAEPEHHFDDLQFPSCVGHGEPAELGLYPIVDSAAWLARLLATGITTAQLRVKHLTGEGLQAEICEAVALAKEYDCRLFINDYWQQAIAAGAYGVHLGQEDLATADLAAIAKAGLRLGISNHCHFELARALTINPSYLACGPIFATTTKQMPWVPYGLAGLNYWCESLTQRPLVAIAGIDQHNIEAIANTGVSGIALITAITQAQDPVGVCENLQQLIAQSRANTAKHAKERHNRD